MTPFIRDTGEIPWEKVKTLEEVVIQLIEEKKTNSPEFKQILEYYGRERLVEIWKKHLEKKKP